MADGDKTDRLSPAFVVLASSDLVAFGGRLAAAAAKRLFGKLFGKGEPVRLVGKVVVADELRVRLSQLVEILQGSADSIVPRILLP